MVQLIPAHEVKQRQMIRVHNQGVAVLATITKDGMTRIRYAATHGNDSIDVPSNSLVPLYVQE